MVLSSGVCRVPELEKAGVAVGLGVDGSASNDCSNLMQEVRQAFMMQRLHYGTQITHLDALRWATSGGATVLRRPELGSILGGITGSRDCLVVLTNVFQKKTWWSNR